MRWILAAMLAASGEAAAQAPSVPRDEQRTITPAPATVTLPKAAPEAPASSRNQFSRGAMGIDIKGEGLSLPTGVGSADEPLVVPPKPAVAPKAPPAK